MATLFSIETVLLEIQKSLGLSLFTTKEKSKFKRLEMQMENFTDAWMTSLDEIFNALDMDDAAKRDAFEEVQEMLNFHKQLEGKLWTFAATEQQIVWHSLAHTLIPFMARKVAFWTDHDKLDKGMPGGKFWYLPEPVTEKGELSLLLPVGQVINWLQDLLRQPMNTVVKGLGDEKIKFKGGEDSLERSLYHWKKGSSLPAVSKINEYFPDTAELEFFGCFELPPGTTPEQAFSQARMFVDARGLTGSALQQEIPMNDLSQLQALLDDNVDSEVDVDVQHQFVRLLLERYQKPNMKTIRQRLLVARMAQDGYLRLLKFLCPGVNKFCCDYDKNKVRQLVALYQRVYNLTMKSIKHSTDHNEQNKFFEASLHPLEKVGLLTSITLSMKEVAVDWVAERLTRIFKDGGTALPNIAAFDRKAAEEILVREGKFVTLQQQEDKRREQLKEQLSDGIALRKKLSAESGFEVLFRLAERSKAGSKVSQLIVARLNELTSSPRQAMHVILLQLNWCLNNVQGKRPKETRHKVEILLAAAKANTDVENWQAIISTYEAKHHLSLNEFKVAGDLFRNALEQCHDRNYGPLRGEVARDLFAIEVSNQRLIPESHERYFRNMWYFGILEGDGVPEIEEVARQASNYFWDTLYTPYPGVPEQRSLVQEATEKVTSSFMRVCGKPDENDLEVWFKQHGNLKDKRLRTVQGDTILMLLIKMLASYRAANEKIKSIGSVSALKQCENMSVLLDNWASYLALMVEKWPKLVDMTDFKGQTPLMLAAQNGDSTIMEQLLKAGADPTIQDYKGRAALHSTAIAKFTQGTNLLLALDKGLDKQTVFDNTALHLAVEVGSPDIVRAISVAVPELKQVKNAQGMTPLDFIRFIIEQDDYVGLDGKLKEIGCSAGAGSKSDYQQVLAHLK